ncbi:MAG: winged helix-turn-helix transcriptional regulator [Myxococcales bacterium]|nr:winged helix-turn-helix transcriptional regulator [Myxococcales bacterium]
MPEAEPVDALLGALADPTRLAIVRALGAEPRRSGELAAALDVSRPAMSRHLRALRDAGVVTDEILADDGRGRVYRLRREPFDALRGFVDEVEAFWGEQLAAFAAHVEGRGRGGR